MEEVPAELKADDWKKAKVNSTSASRAVAKLHRQRGHLNNDKLGALRDPKVDEAIIKEGINYRCETCESHKLKPLEKHVLLPKAIFFQRGDRDGHLASEMGRCQVQDPAHHRRLLPL